MKKKNLILMATLITTSTIGLIGCGNTTEIKEPDTEISNDINSEINNKDVIFEDEYLKLTEQDNKLMISCEPTLNWNYGLFDENIISVNQETSNFVIEAKSEGVSVFELNSIQGIVSYILNINIDTDKTITVKVDRINAEPSTPETETPDVVLELDEEIVAIMDKIYENLEDTQYPPSVSNNPLDITNKDTMMYNFGVESIEGLESGILSEPMMSSIAYSVAVLKFDSNENAMIASKSLKETAQVNKWVCVAAEDVSTRVVNDKYVILTMTNSETVKAIDAIEFD